MLPDKTLHPTPYAELNLVLDELVTAAQATLGSAFLAAYLQGSFATGDFDVYSDVDFLIVTRQELTAGELAALQAMHARLFCLPSTWAQHLDGSYIPRHLLARPDPANTPLWYLDNGSQELVPSPHDNTVVVRWMVREQGITLAGPPPAQLIAPISAAELKQEVLATMRDWGGELFANPQKMNNRWYQPFVVLSYCRMLHTLHTGRVDSKPAAVRWAESSLDSQWIGLIRRAWGERPDPAQKVRLPADPADLQSTIEFMRYALAESRRFY